MDEIGTSQPKPLRRHLHAPAPVTTSTATGGAVDLTRHHGQGNGLRLHGIYFAAVSLAALLIVIAVIALASAMA